MIIDSQGTFKILEEFSSNSDPKNETVKFIPKIDGSISVINYGSRISKAVKITVSYLTLAKQISLLNFLISNVGEKIQLTRENDTEYIFSRSWSASSYYVRVISAEGVREDQFTPTGEAHELTFTVELSGVNLTDELNSSDSSIIEIMVEIDTTNTKTNGFVQSGTPTTDIVGKRWLDTDDNKLYEWDGNSWKEIYTVTANDVSKGFINGVFYLSAFADLSQGTGIDEDHVSGWITNKGISLSRKSIKLNNGPNISRKTGFSVSIQNADKFWSYIQTNGIAIHGAEGKLSFYYSSAATKVKQISVGFVNRPVFNYSEFKLEFEPFRLNDSGFFPKDTIIETDNRYIGAKSNVIGKPVIRSYGEFTPDRPGILQNISTEKKELVIEAYDNETENDIRVDTVVSAYINRLSNTEILINKTKTLTVLHYLLSDIQIDNINNSNDLYSIIVLNDGNISSSNQGEIRKILSIDDSSTNIGFYTINIDFPFTTDPDTDGSLSLIHI